MIAVLEEHQIRARVLFLLREAGPHKACVLAEVIGTTTCEMQHVLSGMRVDGLVEKVSINANDEKWFVLRSSAECASPAP